MGMWTKDREYRGRRIDSYCGIGAEFLVMDAWLPGETIETSIGPAEIARLIVAKVTGEAPHRETGEIVRTFGRPQLVYTVASAIVDKVRDAEPDDFPVIAELEHVTSRQHQTRALVMTLVCEHDGPTPLHPGRGDDQDPAPRGSK